MSVGHFHRSFKEAYGETPYAHLMTRRVERAAALLRRGDLSVTDVCMEVGCTSSGRSARGSPSSWGSPRASTGRGRTRGAASRRVAKQAGRPTRERAGRSGSEKRSGVLVA